ncbi:MAG: hypothetical protein LBU39_04485 [Desulfobulbaceae bacterium]|jgi:hypothetical protein|nr:hypothetical protein [Desulfobulbaceae bacterium]
MINHPGLSSYFFCAGGQYSPCYFRGEKIVAQKNAPIQGGDTAAPAAGRLAVKAIRSVDRDEKVSEKQNGNSRKSEKQTGAFPSPLPGFSSIVEKFLP